MVSAEFSRIFSDVALTPWWMECRNADYPWQANELLKETWRGTAKAGYSAPERLSAALALLRVSGCADEDADLADWVIGKDTDGSRLEVEDVGEILVSGGSPSELVMSVIGNLIATEPTPRLLGSWVRYLRHPSRLHDASTMDASLAPYISSHPDGSQVSGGSVEWNEAIYCFAHRPPPVVGECFLSRVASILRLDAQPTTLRNRLLDQDIAATVGGIISKHPALEQSRIMPYEPASPNRSAIEYAAGAGELGDIWAVWNPMLIYPWLLNASLDFNPPQLLLLGLIGEPIALFQASWARADIDSSLRTVLAAHPSFELDAYLRANENRKTTALGSVA